MRALMAVVIAMAGCMDSPMPTPEPDGGRIGPLPQPDGGVGPVDFFGESCSFQPYPVNTLCHMNAGWCIEGVCRPQCGPDVVRCREGVMHFAPAGACYCTPD